MTGMRTRTTFQCEATAAAAAASTVEDVLGEGSREDALMRDGRWDCCSHVRHWKTHYVVGKRE